MRSFLCFCTFDVFGKLMSSTHWKKVLLSLDKYFLSYGLLKTHTTPTHIKWEGLIKYVIGWVLHVSIAVDRSYLSWTAVSTCAGTDCYCLPQAATIRSPEVAGPPPDCNDDDVTIRNGLSYHALFIYLFISNFMRWLQKRLSYFAHNTVSL